jgi:tetratricopeptide (TPR) repeat protein
MAHAAAEEDLSAQLKKAEALHQQADFAHSIPLLQRIVRQAPRNYTANLLLGKDLLHSGNFRSAIAPLQRACDERPLDASAEIYLADAAAALEEFRLASGALLAGMARSHESERFLEAWASYSLERFGILERSLRSTKRGEAIALRIEAASRPEGSQGRESLLAESAAADPEQPGIWGELGTAQLELHMGAEAVQSLKQTESREPESAGTFQLEALLAGMEGDGKELANRLAALAARSPMELQTGLTLLRIVLPPASALRGTVLNCLRNSASCPYVSVQAAGRAGENAKDLYAKGRWEALLALPPQAVTTGSEWLWRGVALAKTAKCRQAIPALERGLEADQLVAGFWLGICTSTEADRAVTRLKAEKDQAVYPDEKGALHALLAHVLLKLGRDDEATKSEAEARRLSDAYQSRVNQSAEDGSHAKQ